MKPNSNDVMDSSLKQLSHFLNCYKFRVVYCYGENNPNIEEL